jgi:hypothetical protein
MSLTITSDCVIKATQEWKQETRQGGSQTHFDRFFSVNDVKFNVKLKTVSTSDPYIIIETESQELFTGFKILIEYSSGDKSGSLTYNNLEIGSLSKFESPCRTDAVFKSIFKPNGPPYARNHNPLLNTKGGFYSERADGFVISPNGMMSTCRRYINFLVAKMDSETCRNLVFTLQFSHCPNYLEIVGKF